MMKYVARKKQCKYVLYGFVVGPRCQHPAIRADSHAVHLICMPFQSCLADSNTPPIIPDPGEAKTNCDE